MPLRLPYKSLKILFYRLSVLEKFIGENIFTMPGILLFRNDGVSFLVQKRCGFSSVNNDSFLAVIDG